MAQKRRRFLQQGAMAIAGTLGLLGAAVMLASPASARSGGYKYAPDYSDIRGFNYNTASSLNTEDEWRNYKHAEVDRDFSYAERLGLNSVRVFLSYKAWLADKAAFRANLRDFVRTAAAHHIGAMIEVVNGPGGMMPDLFEDSAKPKLREYAKDLVDGSATSQACPSGTRPTSPTGCGRRKRCPIPISRSALPSPSSWRQRSMSSTITRR